MKPSTAFGVRGRLATSDASKTEKQDASKIEKRDAPTNDETNANLAESHSATRPSPAEENHYKQLWWNIKALHLPIVDTLEHWMRQPLGPPISLFGESIQLQRRHAVVGPFIIMLLFGLAGLFLTLIFFFLKLVFIFLLQLIVITFVFFVFVLAL